MAPASVVIAALAASLLLSGCQSDLTLPPGAAVLRVAGVGSGSGTVSASPPIEPKFQCRILNGAAETASCRGVYVPGTIVSLTASPSQGSRFTGWGQACSGTDACQLALADSASVSAGFEPARSTVTIVGAGTGSGTVKSAAGAVPGINCVITAGQMGASGCAGTFLQAGSTLSLTATASSGSNFSGWGGDCSGTTTCSISLDRDRVVSAAFVARSR